MAERMMMPEIEPSGGTGLRVSETEECALSQVQVPTGHPSTNIRNTTEKVGVSPEEWLSNFPSQDSFTLLKIPEDLKNF